MLAYIISTFHSTNMMDMDEPELTGTTMSVDWNKCVLCQSSTTENLQCSLDATNATASGAGYKTISDNIERFHVLGCLPIPMDISQLDDGDGIAEESKEESKGKPNGTNHVS